MKLKHEIQIFFAALTFFTRLPSPISSDRHGGDLLNRAARYFPLIGWIVGGMCALTLWLSGLVLPASISILLSMVAGVITTGAFHEDGFADVCDGFGGGWTKERILDIMKDSRVGAYGVIGIILMLLGKYLSLTELPFHTLSFVIIAGHSISRFASSHCIYTHEYVGNQGTSKAKPLCSNSSSIDTLLGAIWGIIPLFFLGSYWYLLAIIPVMTAKWWMARYFTKWIGGYTGDCLGAIQQVTEVIFYISVLIINRNLA